MKEQFFIIFCGACALSLMVSCGGRRRPAPNFDRRRSQVFMQACEQLDHAGSVQDTAQWEELMKLYPQANFPPVAHRLVQKRQLVTQANALLSDIEFHRLMDLVRESEKEGTACPELLAFAGYRDALDQLRLFMSKMPWMDSGTLRDNLSRLDRYRAVLERSPFYVSFRQTQDEELRRLIVTEQRAHRLKLLGKLDVALMSGRGLGQASAAFLRECTEPTRFERRCLQASTETQVRALHAETQADSLARFAFEVIGLYRWSCLGKGMRDAWLRQLSASQPVSLSGGWLGVRYQLREDSDEVFMRLLSDGSHPCVLSQAIVRELLGSRLLGATHYQAWCWRSPCPSVTEILARLKQMGQHGILRDRNSK